MSVYLDQLTQSRGVLFRALTNRSFFLWEGGYKPASNQVTYLKYTRDAVKVKLTEKVLQSIREYCQEVTQTSLKPTCTVQGFLLLLQDEGALHEEDARKIRAQLAPGKKGKAPEKNVKVGFFPFLILVTVVPVLIDQTMRWMF